MPTVNLVPLTPTRLTAVEPWFDHPQVQRWLGDRSWPRRELRLVGERPGTDFRGMKTLRSYAWVALDESGGSVALIGGDVYDRWVLLHQGETPDDPEHVSAYPNRSMAIVFVVDPGRWGQGYGPAAVRALVASPSTVDVQAFWAGIDVENHASRRAIVSAGFEPHDEEPDFEGMLYYRLLQAP